MYAEMKEIQFGNSVESSKLYNMIHKFKTGNPSINYDIKVNPS